MREWENTEGCSEKLLFLKLFISTQNINILIQEKVILEYDNNFGYKKIALFPIKDTIKAYFY